MNILKDGKIDTSQVQPGDFIQLFHNKNSPRNGIVSKAREAEIIVHIYERWGREEVFITASDIKNKRERFVLSRDLCNALIRVNMPEEDTLFVNSLNWDDSKEDRRSW